MTETLIRPFWETDTVINETILLLSENGGVPEAGLFFKADEIISVRSADLTREYDEGKDYIFKDGKIYLKDGADLPFMDRSELEFEHERPNESFKGKNGGYVLFHIGFEKFFHKRQLCVTYKHSDVYAPDIGICGGKRLGRIKNMLGSGKGFTMCFYGDSITTGCDCSGFLNTPPFMPDWTKLITQTLEERSGCNIKYVNTAVGGTVSGWGAENAGERLGKYRPDIAVIAFGMNDGTEYVPAEEYGKNIRRIMETALDNNSGCEFILVAPSLANPASCFDGLQREYYGVLKKCARDRDAVINMTAIHADLLKRKRFQDMTGNNINHPSDFLTRVYAQVILEAFKDE